MYICMYVSYHASSFSRYAASLAPVATPHRSWTYMYEYV